MKRGATIRRESPEGVSLERKMITRHYLLELIGSRCVGCEICELVCPQEAIDLQPGLVEDGQLVRRPTIDMDPAKCNFCGECVVLCPVNALRLTVNGEPEIPVQQYEAFPELDQEISVDATELSPTAASACEASCPTEAISVRVDRDGTGRVTEVLAIDVQKSESDEGAGCIYCKQCQSAFPKVFSVRTPWVGRLVLDAARCPEDCRVCADACPTDALLWTDGSLRVNETFCLYCGACQQVCPEEGAILVERARILHSPISSGAWTTALEKLISPKAAAQELDAKSQTKRRGILTFMPKVASREP
jgi:4Fe-4S ferredoxin